MAWKVEFSRKAEKEFSRLDHQTRDAIKEYLTSRVRLADDPRKTGKGLGHNKSGLWRYRVGKYRIICQIQDQRLLVLVVQIGKRDSVYDA